MLSNFTNRARKRDIDTTKPDYIERKLNEFLPEYKRILTKYDIPEQQPSSTSFLEKWYYQNIRNEILFCKSLIDEIENERIKKTLKVILSRTMRSSRATAHYDLATLKEPQYSVYYCWKHNKLCKPLYSMKSWFRRYAKDTLNRLIEFDSLRMPTEFAVFSADSRNVNILKEVSSKVNVKLFEIMKSKKLRGIFTSPPYVGQINYHEQHAYAYELFGFDRKDELEIGPLFKGQGKNAQKQYIEGISAILNNSKPFLQDQFDIFLVANDKHNLYPQIAEKSNLQIVNKFKRPVLNRTERDRNPYSEIIFHMKSK